MQRPRPCRLGREEIVERLLDGVIARLHRQHPLAPGALELLAELQRRGSAVRARHDVVAPVRRPDRGGAARAARSPPSSPATRSARPRQAVARALPDGCCRVRCRARRLRRHRGLTDRRALGDRSRMPCARRSEREAARTRTWRHGDPLARRRHARPPRRPVRHRGSGRPRPCRSRSEAARCSASRRPIATGRAPARPPRPGRARRGGRRVGGVRAQPRW